MRRVERFAPPINWGEPYHILGIRARIEFFAVMVVLFIAVHSNSDVNRRAVGRIPKCRVCAVDVALRVQALLTITPASGQ